MLLATRRFHSHKWSDRGSTSFSLCHRKAGNTVIVEAPTYYGLLNILSHLNLRVIAIPSRPEEGLDIEAVEGALDREPVSAIIVVPNFSNPLGSLMPESTRVRLVALASKRKVPILEDDIYGDLHHEGPRPRCLKALDKADGVILCGSFSKTLAPGYRAGYVVAGRHHQKIAQMKNALSFGGAPLPLMAVAEFLRNGGYDHHLRTLRVTYRNQVSKMREALEAEFPKDVKISNPSGGFVIWVELPPSVDALTLFHQARDANISIAPGHLFSPAAEFKNFIRVSCGYPWDVHIEEAVGTLGKLISRLLESYVPHSHSFSQSPECAKWVYHGLVLSELIWAASSNGTETCDKGISSSFASVSGTAQRALRTYSGTASGREPTY